MKKIKKQKPKSTGSRTITIDPTKDASEQINVALKEEELKRRRMQQRLNMKMFINYCQQKRRH